MWGGRRTQVTPASPSNRCARAQNSASLYMGLDFLLPLPPPHTATPLHAPTQIDAFPRASVVARNGCTPGVPTPYMIMCLEASVDPDTDLVFVEYTLK